MYTSRPLGVAPAVFVVGVAGWWLASNTNYLLICYTYIIALYYFSQSKYIFLITFLYSMNSIICYIYKWSSNAQPYFILLATSGFFQTAPCLFLTPKSAAKEGVNQLRTINTFLLLSVRPHTRCIYDPTLLYPNEYY